MSSHRALRLALATSGAALASCAAGTGDGQCIPPPCALPVAIVVNVTAAAGGGSVVGATVKVSGATTSTVRCNSAPGTTCYVPGIAGTYSLEVDAPGFASVQRTVVVQGTTPACECPTVLVQSLDIALVAVP